jgi:hypothetical protein
MSAPAVPLVAMPKVEDKVYYCPQEHIEQVSTNQSSSPLSRRRFDASSRVGGNGEREQRVLVAQSLQGVNGGGGWE